MKLSIIIPIFNEEKTVSAILEKVVKLKLVENIQKEIIIVDDGSQDSTSKKVKEFIRKIKEKNITFFIKPVNEGKGSAVKKGIEIARGDYIIIQDADLEYDPQQINTLLKFLITEKVQVVFGSRLNRLPNLSKEERRPQFLLHYLGNRLLSLLTSILFWQWITDMETCYKLFPRAAFDKTLLKSKGFEMEPEITAKLIKRGYHIYEVPIIAVPRGYEDGKKLNTVVDGIKAFKTILRYRFSE